MLKGGDQAGVAQALWLLYLSVVAMLKGGDQAGVAQALWLLAQGPQDAGYIHTKNKYIAHLLN